MLHNFFLSPENIHFLEQKYNSIMIRRISVLILDGNSEHVAHARRKIGLLGEKYLLCDCSRSNQMP